MTGEGKVVCVTGASGCTASWLVKQLLERGYTVKATVPDPNDPKIKHLYALDGAKERLYFFKANLLEEGSFDSAVDGCEGVFHTASPVMFSTDNPQVELIDPAVKGTLNVLSSCAKVQSVKRVAVTSSMASVLQNENPLTPDVDVDETWFSSVASCEKSKLSSTAMLDDYAVVELSSSLLPLWYSLSKTLAEEAAWKLAEENGTNLVTMHLGVVIGPFLQPTVNLSMEVILNLINGVQTYPNPYRFVDVRDVAYAHIQALGFPTASGRYVLVARFTKLYEIRDLLHRHYPTLHLNENYVSI